MIYIAKLGRDRQLCNHHKAVATEATHIAPAPSPVGTGSKIILREPLHYLGYNPITWEKIARRVVLI